MTSSRSRRRRRTDRKLVLDGDFPDTGESVTEILGRVRPADYDGTTITFGGASDAGLLDRDVYPHGAYPDPDPAEGLRQAIELTAMGERGAYTPVPVGAPQRTHTAAGKGWSMTVNTGGPGVPMDARCRNALAHLKLEAADYEAQGMSYRIDEAELARQRGEDLDERSVIAGTLAKAVRHLLGPREPWDPEA